MNGIKKTIITTLSLLITTTAIAKDFRVNAVGNLNINGQNIPAYSVGVSDPTDEKTWLQSTPSATARQIKVKSIKPEQAAQLSAFYLYYGTWILAPRGWQVSDAKMGVDGNAVLTISSPDKKGYVSYYNVPACAGCGESAASIYFPEARKDAINDGFSTYNPPRGLKSTRLRPNLIAYRIQNGADIRDGLAYYQHNSEPTFWQLETKLPETQKHLASPILNWFVPKK